MCQRQSFFRVNANCSSVQEGRRGGFTAVFYLHGANWDRAKEVWGCAGWWQNGWADFIICGDFGNTTCVCNFYETSISPANTQAGALPTDHSLLWVQPAGQMSSAGYGLGEAVAAHFRCTHIRHPKEQAAGDFPLLLSADRWVAPAPSKVPCMGMQWPRTGGWSPSLWSFVGRVFLGFYGYFLLIIWVQLCLMSWKRSRSIKHVFAVSRIPVGPCVCL